MSGELLDLVVQDRCWIAQLCLGECKCGSVESNNSPKCSESWDECSGAEAKVENMAGVEVLFRKTFVPTECRSIINLAIVGVATLVK